MFLIEVIPIARGITKDTLSYFSSSDIKAGSLVTIPIRKKTVSALVISSKDASLEKSSIKSSDFSMRKISDFKSENFLSDEFMRAAKMTADFSVGSLGSVLNLLVPKIILENITQKIGAKKVLEKSGMFDKLALQAEDEERFATYRSLVREEFAKKKSVFICLPTAEEVKNLSSLLPKGIEDYTYAFYNSLTKKKMVDLWDKAIEDEHPILIIATAPFFALCRGDLGTIIIENESSRSYKLPIRPYLDVRVFAEFFAKESNIRVIFGDTLLRTETIYRVKQGEVAELSPLKFRSLTPATSTIIDMSNYKKTGNGKFETVSPELENLIKLSQTKNQNLFIFAGRRGFAPQTVCGDCGTIVLCSRCKSPITLHLAKQDFSEHNFFFCHNCGEQRNAEERCAKCQSWKLLPIGIGIELITEEIKRKIPNIKIFRVDKDSASTKIKAEKIVEEFYASPGSVLIGTEMTFSYLDRKISNTAVASLDAMFSLPDFRIHEKILHILIKIRSLAETNFIVQTRIPNEKILDYAVKGNLMDFYREEIQARESFRYPPFTTLIKVSLTGQKEMVEQESDKLSEFFKPCDSITFPAFVEESKGSYTMHTLIRLKRGSWINRDLLQKLLSLSPQFRIVVEPESLL